MAVRAKIAWPCTSSPEVLLLKIFSFETRKEYDIAYHCLIRINICRIPPENSCQCEETYRFPTFWPHVYLYIEPDCFWYSLSGFYGIFDCFCRIHQFIALFESDTSEFIGRITVTTINLRTPSILSANCFRLYMLLMPLVCVETWNILHSSN